MGRLIAIQVGLFVLPFLLFWLWVKLGRRADIPRPTAWLVIVGLVLAIVGIVVAGLLGGREPGSDFAPARMENGDIVRGSRGG